jgi:hypothetical protein
VHRTFYEILVGIGIFCLVYFLHSILTVASIPLLIPFHINSLHSFKSSFEHSSVLLLSTCSMQTSAQTTCHEEVEQIMALRGRQQASCLCIIKYYQVLSSIIKYYQVLSSIIKYYGCKQTPWARTLHYINT